MSGKTFIFILSLIAGVVGTGVGGALGASLKNKSDAVMGKVLSYAGGVMAGVVAFEMMPNAVSSCVDAVDGKAGALIAVAALVTGIAMIFGLNKLLDAVERKRLAPISTSSMYREHAVLQSIGLVNGRSETSRSANGKTASVNGAKDRHSQIYDNRNAQSSGAKGKIRIAAADSKRLFKAGVIMLIAIALHNFPEGMAIGAAGVTSTSTGILLAVIIAVHNIPEGMAIAAPLVGGGVKWYTAVGLTALAGAATALGALIGLAVGGTSLIATGICMGIAGGAMLFVTLCEILPQSILLNGGKVPAASMLTGMICAIIFVYCF